MTQPGIVALLVLAGATILFLSKRVPIALTALLVPVVLHVTGVLPDERDALRGFGSHAALAIAAIFVLGAGLKESGVATLLARGIQRCGGRSETGLVVSVMVATALLSSVMSNVAVVAILLPVAAALSRRSGVAPSRLLMPLAFAAMLGGTITTIGTAPNFLVEDFLRTNDHGFHFAILDFAPVGLAITATGILFMALVGRRLLPVVRHEDRIAALMLPEDVAESFAMASRLSMLGVAETSRVVGQSIADADLRARYGTDIVMVRRGRAALERWLQPDPELVFQPGDRLYVQGAEEQAWLLAETELLQFGLAGPRALQEILGHGTTFAEVAVPPRSRAIGRTFKDMDFRKRFGLNVLALVRGGRRLTAGSPRTEPLAVGDTFVVSGEAERVRGLATRPDWIVMTDQSEVEDMRHAPLALLLLAVAILPPLLGLVALPVSALGAAVLMVLTGCVSRPALGRAIDWNVICLIVGTLPLGIALERHGVASAAAELVSHVGGGLGAAGILGVLFLVSAGLAVLTSNAAAAVIVAPVAARAAEAAQAAGVEGVTLRGLLMAVAYGCSCAFLLPYAQCNILVMGPGGYRTRDFLRVGAWASLVMAATAIGLLACCV